MWSDLHLIHIRGYSQSFVFYLLPKYIDPLMHRPYGKTTAADNQWWSNHKPTIGPRYSNIQICMQSSNSPIHPAHDLHIDSCASHWNKSAKCNHVCALPSSIHPSCINHIRVHAHMHSAVTGENMCNHSRSNKSNVKENDQTYKFIFHINGFFTLNSNCNDWLDR